jgi:hypothetical protein
MVLKMESRRVVLGYEFQYDEDNSTYECRGEVCYDDEHDEVPDPALWKASKLLVKNLKSESIIASAQYSEKGWQEVVLSSEK